MVLVIDLTINGLCIHKHPSINGALSIPLTIFFVSPTTPRSYNYELIRSFVSLEVIIDKLLNDNPHQHKIKLKDVVMKKYLLILLSGWPFLSISQNREPTVKIVPPNFTPRDTIKIIIDVSEVTELSDEDSLYLWAWKDKPGGTFQNGSWENSSEQHRLKREGKGVFSFKMVPYAFYGEHPDSLEKNSIPYQSKKWFGE